MIVPSHGPNGDGSASSLAIATYLTEVRDRTAAEKHAGHSVEEATETVTAAFGSALSGQGAARGRDQGGLRGGALSACVPRRLDETRSACRRRSCTAATAAWPCPPR